MTTASTTKANQNLVRILIDLKNRSEDIRLKAAKNLNEFLDEISREYTAYESDKITRDVFHALTESLKSADPYERMGAIQGLGKNTLI
ncbi:hypothetical protein CONCODRAFT_14274 [Conidiobolus coronatus NRRL 28638]|uniref:CLASP N-terminal domain-containing protein n=1 Tax=Conidiobolus coronatus (strain ATCC 28846 / CBS 209.66 / NRRL 28638) TaxID=796925 RepID=A0A137NPB4_CONC2|nr:hypothetical protein CONCODRAFT_14274 [Conidiobolus coronatus NRRL 28638]|eukprot:KXN64575.1 hypothetical protein CONCODRAFT_14274 [Conidiobolus coronatus NRRL 28638]